MTKIKLVILGNEILDDCLLWEKACQYYNEKVEYRIVNLTQNNWLEKIFNQPFDLLVAKPSGFTAKYKQLYDERIAILEQSYKLLIYPTSTEIYIYENKRYLYSWLKANGLPHPETFISYNLEEAMEFISKVKFPLVAKINIGASGSGVKILANIKDAEDYVNQSFSSKGVSRRWGPNFKKGGLIKRAIHYVFNPSDIKKKVKTYAEVRKDVQVGFVILQKFIPHNYEWRIVVIGESYFAHKKLKKGEMASGSLLKNYDNPPMFIFDFVKTIIDKYGFRSQAIDVFESEGNLYINEMQCIFGQSDEYQMLVDGKIGRYRNIDGSWIFEEGNFNQNQSYNLRVEDILEKTGKI